MGGAGGGECIIEIKIKTREDDIRQDKTRRHNKTSPHEDKTIRHDNMTNNKVTSKEDKPKRLEKNTRQKKTKTSEDKNTRYHDKRRLV